MPKRREPDITMFSFGYWGWGSSTEELVKAADAVERSRGYKPPIFVDIRISRSVRAPGFNGNTFGELLGAKRYVWIKRLGNRSVISRGKKRIQIDDPSAASDLLDLAIDAAENNRRIIFFCNCPFPKTNGKVRCHRYEVSELLIREAKRRGIDLRVIEWPGEEPIHVLKKVSKKEFNSIAAGKPSFRLGDLKQVAEVAGLPWASILTLKSGEREIHRLTCPAIHKAGAWSIPFLYWFHDAATPISAYRTEGKGQRKNGGLDEYRSK